MLAEYVAVLIGQKQLGAALKLLNRAADDTFDWREAASRMLEIWPVGSKKWSLRKFVDRHRDALRAETRLWGKAGYALLQSGQSQETMRWMIDWRYRDDMQPWMLLNLVAALYDCGLDSQTSEVSRAALELPPDEDTALHKLWLTSSAAQSGDFATARQGVDESAGLELKQYYRLLRTAAEAAVLTHEELLQYPSASMLWVLRAFYRHGGLRTMAGNRTIRRIQARSVRAMLEACGRTRAGRIAEWLVKRI